MKRIAIIILFLSCCTSVLEAQDRETIEIIRTDIPDSVLDTMTVRQKLKLNDYSMIGVQYGASMCQVMWNPSQKQDMVILPVNYGVTFTTYGKMFGYMPYFGFQVGLFYGKEGYQFEYNENTDYTYKIEGAEKAVFEVVELPVLSHFHVDLWRFKILAQIGFYTGYRLSIERFPGKTGHVEESVAHSFLETDNRFDFGIKGGVGFGLVFDPIEIHFQAMYKHSMSSLYEPDHASRYYYRYAYPYNITVSAGVHFQLTKRSGRTKAEIRKLAKEIVSENGKR